ncbi:cell division protein FtsL [Colwelliaceae bacterium BS250]
MALGKLVLSQEIWQDIRRFSWSYGLLILVLVSAFSVIYFTHLNRQTTSELERLYTDRDGLDIEWRNLRLEQNSLSEHSEIESQAEKLLLMKRAKPSAEVVIKLP